MKTLIFMRGDGVLNKQAISNALKALQKTVKKLEEAYNFVRDLSASGQTLLFVGTKKQAQDCLLYTSRCV